MTSSNRSDAEPVDTRVWRVDTGASHRGLTKRTMIGMVVIALVPVVVMASGVDLAAFQGFMQRFGVVIVLGFLALCYLPMLFHKQVPSFLHLDHDRLRFEGPPGQQTLALAGLQLSFARVEVHGTFLGTLCVAWSPHGDQQMRLFASGAELQPGAYDLGTASVPRDAWSLDRRAFQELMTELATSRAAAPAASAPASATTGAASPATGPTHAAHAVERIFEARVPASAGWMVGASFLPFLLLAGGVAASKISWSTRPLAGIAVMAGIMLLCAGPAYLVVRGLRARKHGRVSLRISAQALVLEGTRGEIVRTPLPAQAPVFTWRNHWSHRRRYDLGAAVRLTDVHGKTVTLGISDQAAIRPGTPKISNVDFVLSADAGEHLLHRLQ